MTTMRLLLLLVVCCALLAPPAAARPPHRQKRVSDQRLAELETLLALAKMKNRKYVTLPVGFGLIDVKQIGRRKRAAAAAANGLDVSSRDMPQQLDEYDIGDLLSDLSSVLSNDSLREDRSMEDSSYPMEDLSLAEVVKETGRKASRMKEEHLPAGVREAPPAILFGVRDVPHHRFI
ncbi:uncharacterized protein [Panulirus ornatus]